jgi:hypothetical protein
MNNVCIIDAVETCNFIFSPPHHRTEIEIHVIKVSGVAVRMSICIRELSGILVILYEGFNILVSPGECLKEATNTSFQTLTYSATLMINFLDSTEHFIWINVVK